MEFNMELDKAFKYAVILAWEDLAKVARPCSARVEYLCEPGTALDYLSVWSVRAEGEQDLVCDYWTWTSSAHPSGVRFRNGHRSDELTQILDLIMKNQDRFTRPADAGRHGLILIYPPAEDARAEAAAWMREVQGALANIGVAAGERSPLSTPSITNRTPEGEAAVTWADAYSLLHRVSSGLAPEGHCK
jgi:hypothetical protein